MRTTIAAVVLSALALAPATAAFAEEAPTDAEPTAELSPADVLGQWLDAIVALAGLGDDEAPAEGDEGAEDGTEDATDEATPMEVLLDELLRGIEIQLMVDRAMAEATEDEGDEGEGAEDEGAEDEGEGDEADEATHGALVSTVAQCAPRGKDAKGFLAGAKNHGAYVSAVARGAQITLEVPTIVETDENDLGMAVDGSTTLDLTVETLEDAQVLCDALATIAEARAIEQALAAGDEDVSDRDAAKAEREAAKDERKAERDAAKAERKAARDAAKAERDAAKAERAAAKRDR